MHRFATYDLKAGIGGGTGWIGSFHFHISVCMGRLSGGGKTPRKNKGDSYIRRVIEAQIDSEFWGFNSIIVLLPSLHQGLVRPSPPTQNAIPTPTFQTGPNGCSSPPLKMPSRVKVFPTATALSSALLSASLPPKVCNLPKSQDSFKIRVRLRRFSADRTSAAVSTLI